MKLRFKKRQNFYLCF